MTTMIRAGARAVRRPRRYRCATAAVEVGGRSFHRSIARRRQATEARIWDVQELIKSVSLPASIAEDLPPWVRAKFLELWQLAQTPDAF